jgi:DNA (cytosine-5)-methyltransferase 1
MARKPISNQSQVDRSSASGHRINRRVVKSRRESLVKRSDSVRTDYPAFLERELPRKAPQGKWRSASFFCGCGGFDLGFRSAGIGTVYANDLYARAAETFEQNLGHKVDVQDVRDVKADTLKLGDLDVLTGGFPCVTFSMAGKRAGVEDSVNGMLYLELCRLISELKPRYFVAENVKGMLSANGGGAIKLVLAAFLRLGYWTYYELVNMADHGVPQTRQRVIFVGIRRDEHRGAFRFPRSSHRRKDDSQALGWLPIARSLREAIGDLPEPGEKLIAQNDMLDDQQRHIEAENRRSKQRAPTDPSFVVRAANGPPIVVADHDKLAGAGRSSKWNASVRGDGDETTPGITVAAQAGSGAPLHHKGLRRMTVRECARVQSFPDWFSFAGSMSDGYKQVGNAVPPLYAKHLAEALLEYDKRDKL